MSYSILTQDPVTKTMSAPNINFKYKEDVPENVMDRQILVETINYVVNNIELQKLLYGDPYIYKDELKRLKSFSSPRQSLLYGSKGFANRTNELYNYGRRKNDIGYRDFNKEYFDSATVDDVWSINKDIPEYEDPYEETDGSGIMIFPAFRHMRIQSDDWTDDNERQYLYDIAYEKIDKSKGLSREEIIKKGLMLTREEQDIYAEGNPQVKDTYTPKKPIVTGNRLDGGQYNDIVLDKFAIYPLSYRVQHELNPESNAVRMYNKMQNHGQDYIVFKSGRKVGSRKQTAPYNENGIVDEVANFDETIKIPFQIFSIQAEVPSKDNNFVTMGSQPTKLV